MDNSRLSMIFWLLSFHAPIGFLLQVQLTRPFGIDSKVITDHLSKFLLNPVERCIEKQVKY
jgi:hypothetical protein